MGRALVQWGVPASDILLDEDGDSTRRSIMAAKRVSLGSSSRLLLVSSPYHMHRICLEAKRQGLAGVACPAPATPIMLSGRSRRKQMLRELAANWWYTVSAWMPVDRRTRQPRFQPGSSALPVSGQAAVIVADAASASLGSTSPASLSS